MWKGIEETTYIEQRVGLHMKIKAVNGWCAGGIELENSVGEKGKRVREVTVQATGEISVQAFLENIDRKFKFSRVIRF